MDAVTAKLVSNAGIFLDVCLKAKADETVLIITNEKLMRDARAVAAAAAAMGAHPAVMDLTDYLAGAFKKGRVLEPVKAAIEKTDMAVSVGWCASFGPLIGQPEINDVFLTARDRRIYLMCGRSAVPMESWQITRQDVAGIWDRTNVLMELLGAARTVRVTTALGTDLTFRLGEGSNCTPVLGIAPLYGEVAIAPVQGSESGVYVVDGATQMGVRPHAETDRAPLRIVVEKGRVKDYDGDPVQVARLKDFIGSGSPLADRVDEVGIPTTLIKENDLWWEDVTHLTRTVHIALGNNLKRDRYVHGVRHMDGQLSRPTVMVDGKVVLKDGEFVGALKG
jgi:leucyl aminopeptidase (aminopeptidase T)